MTLSIRLGGTKEEVQIFLNVLHSVLQVEEMSSMPIPNSNGQVFQYCKWENPNVPGQPS